MTSREGSAAEPEAQDLAAELVRAERRHLLDLAVGVLVAQQAVEPAVAAQSLQRMAAEAGLPEDELAADIVNAACATDAVTAGRTGVPEHQLLESRAKRRVVSAAEVGGDLDEVAATILDELRPLGLAGLLVWQRASGDCLQLIGAAGFPSLVKAQWAQIPPQWRALPQQVLGDGVPVWLPRGVQDPRELPGPARESARAVLPLGYSGPVAGVALVVWEQPREFDPELRRRVVGLLEVLARLLASGVSGTHPGAQLPVLASLLGLLAQPAVVLRRRSGAHRPEQPEQGATLFVEYLNAAAERLGSGVPRPVGRPLEHVLPGVAADLASLVARAHASGVQRVQRLPLEPLPREGTTQRRQPLINVRVLAVTEERCAVLWHAESQDHSFSMLRRAGHFSTLAAFEDDTARGVVQWSERVAPCLGLPADAEPMELERIGALLVPADRGEFARMLEILRVRLEGTSGVLRVPRRDGGVRHLLLNAEPLLTHGTLTGITGSFQDVSIQHQTEAALAATVDELGSVQAEAALRHKLALRLQQAIVPEQPDVADLPGVEAVARYRPAAEVYRVGGDWYDVVRPPDGQVVIAVGDVAGHGIDAATGMVALRNALRGLACSGEDPGRLMHWLNEVALRTPGRPTATALCARFDPATRLLRWTSAGHLPPLLLRDGVARLLDASPNLLLGAAPAVTYRESELDLRPGDMVLLCTDGLIERRSGLLDDALALLARTVESLAAVDDLESLADTLLDTAVGDTDDDASLVLVRFA